MAVTGYSFFFISDALTPFLNRFWQMNFATLLICLGGQKILRTPSIYPGKIFSAAYWLRQDSLTLKQPIWVSLAWRGSSEGDCKLKGREWSIRKVIPWEVHKCIFSNSVNGLFWKSQICFSQTFFFIMKASADVGTEILANYYGVSEASVVFRR